MQYRQSKVQGSIPSSCVASHQDCVMLTLVAWQISCLRLVPLSRISYVTHSVLKGQCYLLDDLFLCNNGNLKIGTNSVKPIKLLIDTVQYVWGTVV